MMHLIMNFTEALFSPCTTRSLGSDSAVVYFFTASENSGDAKFAKGFFKIWKNCTTVRLRTIRFQYRTRLE